MSTVNKTVVNNETEVVVTKSSQIVQFHKDGLTIRQIADKLGIKYQHVYNTLKSKNLIESVDQDRTDTKTAKIIEHHRAGKSRGEIAKELGISYQFVNNVLVSKKLITPVKK